MSTTTLTSKGQVTIPKEIREHLELKPGDKLDFVIHGEKVIVLAQNKPLSRLRGILSRPGKPLTLEEMDAAIAAGAMRSMDTDDP